MKFVFIIGLGIITCLFFHDLFNYLKYLFTNTDGWLSLYSIYSSIFAVFGIIIIEEFRFHPTLINEKCCISHFQPLILLIPSTFPLGYYCVISFFQIIDGFTVDEINEENGAWMNIIFSIFKFAGFLFSFLWYLYLIQVAFFQYKIARKRAKRLLFEERLPLPPLHQCQSSVDIQNESPNDSIQII